MSSAQPSRSLPAHFAAIQDPRINRRKRHHLGDILVIALCAMIAGAEDFVSIEMFGQTHRDWFQARLALPNGIPSHDTFARVFARLDPQALETAFRAWIAALQSPTDAATAAGTAPNTQEVVSLDGKTVRHSFDTLAGKAAIHMVSAWASQARLVLGQLKVDDKTNEITAIPDLLDLLDVTGCLVTCDAMGCQKAIAAKIHQQQGTYVLALKDNQPGLHQAAQLFLEHAQTDRFQALTTRTYTTLDKDHGRIETRHYRIVDLPEGIAWADEKQQWPGLTSLGVVTATRQIGEKTSTETRHFITNMSAAPKDSARRLARAVRSHWGIENCVHWVLDVCFHEDACRVRKDHAPENLSVMRHIALNLFRQDTRTKRSIRGKRLLAAWDITYLETLLGI